MAHLPKDPDESYGSEEDSEAVRDAYLKEQQEKLAIEKEGIINDQNMIAEEKTHLLEELKVETVFSIPFECTFPPSSQLACTVLFGVIVVLIPPFQKLVSYPRCK